MKTRIAYGIHKKTKKEFFLGDTVEGALNANMMCKDYEKALMAANPQLEIAIRIERRGRHE